MTDKKRIFNPQQEEFLKNYLDPSSETWSNATQSAIKAGYEPDYADNIMALMPKWLSEALQDTGLVEKAVKNLSEFIGDNPNQNIKWDATKFSLTTLGKKKFSNKGEDAAEKLAENITGMKIINDGDRDAER